MLYTYYSMKKRHEKAENVWLCVLTLLLALSVLAPIAMLLYAKVPQ
jgi:hypothetical protein